MQQNYTELFSPAEIDYLRSRADDYGWYLWTDDTKAIIEGLCARRLMAANGDFKVVIRNEGRANLNGRTARPVESVQRYYELVGLGRIAFAAMQRDSLPIKTPGTAAEKDRVPVRHS